MPEIHTSSDFRHIALRFSNHPHFWHFYLPRRLIKNSTRFWGCMIPCPKSDLFASRFWTFPDFGHLLYLSNWINSPSKWTEKQFDLDFILDHDSQVFLLISFCDSEIEIKREWNMSLFFWKLSRSHRFKVSVLP